MDRRFPFGVFALALGAMGGAGFAFGREAPEAGALLAMLSAGAAALCARALARPRAAPAPSPAAPDDSAPARLLAQVPAAILVVDSEGGVRLSNPAATALLGRDPTGRPLTAALRAPEIRDALAGAPAEASVLRHDDSGERALRAVIRPLAEAGPLWREGPPPQALILLEDATAARRIEAARIDFVANASHELKTPLAALSGLIETLQGPAREDPAAQGRFWGLMSSQLARMTRLVEDLLSLSRIEAGEHSPPRETQDLALILDEAAALMRPLAAERGVSLVIEPPPPGGARVFGDHDQLAQVFVNLLDNAIKYGRSARGAPVRALWRGLRPGSPPRLGVMIADEGSGVEARHKARLTERFYRVDAAGSRAMGGTGLGLAIVKHIVNRHRGLLEIDSAPGEGARFTVWLPLAEEKKP